MKSQVYFNIRKKEFSIKSGGRVVCRASKVFMRGCRFKVSESGRQRVLSQKKKNVHAEVCGEVVEPFQVDDNGRAATYNPYRDMTFVYRDGGALFEADRVLLEVVDKKARITVWSDSL